VLIGSGLYGERGGPTRSFLVFFLLFFAEPLWSLSNEQYPNIHPSSLGPPHPTTYQHHILSSSLKKYLSRVLQHRSVCHKHSSSWPANSLERKTETEQCISSGSAPKCAEKFLAAAPRLSNPPRLFKDISDKDIRTVVCGTQLNWSGVVILMTQQTHKDFLFSCFSFFFFVFFAINSSHFYIARQQNGSGSCLKSALFPFPFHHCHYKRGLYDFWLFFLIFFFFFSVLNQFPLCAI